MSSGLLAIQNQETCPHRTEGYTTEFQAENIPSRSKPIPTEKGNSALENIKNSQCETFLFNQSVYSFL